MKYFNELNEAYERSMLARGEPQKGEHVEKPKDAEIYDWDQFVEWAKGSGPDLELVDYKKWWDCWKEGYCAGVESAMEDEE